MPGGINISQGIIPHVREAIQTLRIAISRHKGIRTQESSQLGRIESSIEVIDSQARHLALTGEQAICVNCTSRKPRLPEGIALKGVFRDSAVLRLHFHWLW